MTKEKLILLPGWSMRETVWEPIMPFFNERFNPIFCDWHEIDEAKGYKNKVWSLLEKEDGKVYLLGWSLGSLLAIEGAYRYKDKITGLILVSGTSRFIRDNKTGYLCGWHDVALKKMKTALKVDLLKTINTFYTSMFTKEEILNESHRDFIRNINSQPNENAEELEAGLDLLLKTDTRDMISNIEVSTLLIHGEKDTICPIQASEYLADHIKGKAVLRIMKDTGHIPFWTNTDDFKKIIEGFVAQGGVTL